MFLLQVVFPLLLPEWVLYLSGWVAMTAQFTLTTANFSHAGRPRRAGPGVSTMYQYEWIMLGWAPGVFGCQRMGPQGGFHTEELATHCMQLAWFETGSRPMGRPSGLVSFGYSCWNRQRGSMLSPDLVSILTWTEMVPLLLALAGSFMTVYTSLHCWELMLSMIISFGCMSPTVLQSNVAINRSLCSGLFSVLALAACEYLPFLWLWNRGWWQDACGLVVLELWHFACQWPFFPQPLHAESWGGQLCLLGGCWQVQLGHSAYDVCGLESCAWKVWHTVCTTCPAHIAATPDSTA